MSIADERTHGGHHVLVPLGEKADPAGVQDKHDQLALGACVLSRRNRPTSSSALATDAGGRLSDLLHKFGKIPIRFLEEFLPSHLLTNGTLQKL